MTSVTADPRFKSDQIFNQVSRQFITLKDHEMQAYNVHLRVVLDAFIEEMKRKDPLFRACFRRIAYVGSYYEGLKVGKPEEFDLNIIINLPIDYSTLQIIIAPEKPGYIKLKGAPDMLDILQKHVRWSEYNGCITWDLGDEFGSENSYCSQENHYVIKLSEFFTKKKYKKRWYYKPNKNAEAQSNLVKNPINSTEKRRRRRRRQQTMEKWIDPKMYLDQNKFRSWFESVGTRAFSSFPPVAGGKYLLRANGKDYHLKHQKNGPAWTLKIDVPDGHTVDVDLVPALEFATKPPKPFINRNTTKQSWFAISKPLEGSNDNILWRPSFYEREQDILKGSIKQVIRQTKKLRDTQNMKSIASYYIKTLFLRELEKLNTEAAAFQRLPSNFQFYYMLQRLQEACAKHEIIDFWNPMNNLLSGIKPEEMSNISCRLNRIVKDIDRKIDIDRYIIAEYILTRDELVQLKGSIEAMRHLTNGIASVALEREIQIPEPPQREGFLSGMWNSFWNPERVPAAL